MKKTKVLIPISIKKITLFLLAIFSILILGDLTGLVIKYQTGHDSVFGLIELFDLDHEQNLTTYFSTINLLISSLLLFIIANYKKINNQIFTKSWYVLSGIFLYLSVDEGAKLHELLMRPTEHLLGCKKVFYFAWVLPGLIAVSIFGLLYLKFFLHLPKKYKTLFFLSALIFVGGAIGIEIIDGHYASLHGGENAVYELLTSLEEGMEVAGIILFIYTLLSYIRDYIKDIKLTL